MKIFGSIQGVANPQLVYFATLISSKYNVQVGIAGKKDKVAAKNTSISIKPVQGGLPSKNKKVLKAFADHVNSIVGHENHAKKGVSFDEKTFILSLKVAKAAKKEAPAQEEAEKAPAPESTDK